MIRFPKPLQAIGPYIGQPTSRVEGRLKVTGTARYAADFEAPDLAHGFVVSSAIAKGRIARIDTAGALALEGVLGVLTHENRPSLARFDLQWKDIDAPVGVPLRPLHDASIAYSGQPVALVVAESFELARHAASLLEVEYVREPHETDLQKWRARLDQSGPPGTIVEKTRRRRGDARAAFSAAAVRVDAQYATPAEHHNPIETHAATAIHRPDGTLEVYAKTQSVSNDHGYLRRVFGLSKKKLHVRAPFVGGAFGSGLRPQYSVFMAVMAAMQLQRSVRVALTREQMFTFGHRPATLQRVTLGAAVDGRLESLTHRAISETSRFEDHAEAIVKWSGSLYRCDNVALDYDLARLDVHTPLDMRAPGAAQGLYALECAMDELAWALGSDPVALRLRNYAERDQQRDKPFSSKELRACYEQGAERFGWTRRVQRPGAMREGRKLVGWGMASGVWEALQMPARASATLRDDGTLTVASGTTDIGTGTYTVMTQLAADILGLAVEDVRFELGDTAFPLAPPQGGSATAASVGAAVKAACDQVRTRVLKLARKLGDLPIANGRPDDVRIAQGRLYLSRDPSCAVSIVDVLRRSGVPRIEEKATVAPNLLQQRPYSRGTHSAVFAEVKVDEDLGIIQVSRVVSAVAAGRILNPKAARSQIVGGVVWGIGMALHEETVTDHLFGRYMNPNLSEYHFPVNADIENIEVIFVEEHDDSVNPLGIKGVGEIGVVGVAAAVANAVYHATGIRVRELPITLDKLLREPSAP